MGKYCKLQNTKLRKLLKNNCATTPTKNMGAPQIRSRKSRKQCKRALKIHPHSHKHTHTQKKEKIREEEKSGHSLSRDRNCDDELGHWQTLDVVAGTSDLYARYGLTVLREHTTHGGRLVIGGSGARLDNASDFALQEANPVVVMVSSTYGENTPNV